MIKVDEGLHSILSFLDHPGNRNNSHVTRWLEEERDGHSIFGTAVDDPVIRRLVRMRRESIDDVSNVDDEGTGNRVCGYPRAVFRLDYSSVLS
jgi:hypothetical protein